MDVRRKSNNKKRKEIECEFCGAELKRKKVRTYTKKITLNQVTFSHSFIDGGAHSSKKREKEEQKEGKYTLKVKKAQKAKFFVS